MSFIKFVGQPDSYQRPLHWGRAKIDGAPFRGSALPLLKQEEAESLLEQSFDVGYGTFDTSKPDQVVSGHTLQKILDSVVNGWYRILSLEQKWAERDSTPVMFIFIAWAMPFMELSEDAKQTGMFPTFSPRPPHSFNPVE